jgi:probable phosphoglycerate mutase
MLKSRLLGENPCDVDRLFRKIKQFGHHARQGGESGVSVLARALPVIREIVVTRAGQNVVVVSHKATIRLLLCGLLGVDARGYRDRFDQSPACLNVRDFKDPVRARLTLFNDISHYADHAARPHAQLSKWWDVPEKTA